MIITKKRFNLTPGYRGKWPFNVPEVTVMIMIDPKNKTALFGLVHRFGRFALSGALEPFGFSKLIEAGIWADDTPATIHKVNGNPIGTPAVKKSLTPFFNYIQAVAVRELGGKKPGGKRNGE